MIIEKSLRRALLLAVMALTFPSVCSAERIRLDFAVDITTKQLDLDTTIDVDLSFDYSIYVDTAVRYSYAGDRLPLGAEAYTEFAGIEAPPSSLTPEVLGAAGTVLSNRYSELFVRNEYDVRGWYDGDVPSTFEAIYARAGANDRPDGKNYVTSYNLAFLRTQRIGDENQTRLFTESSMLGYLSSLIGDDVFSFSETVYVNERQPPGVPYRGVDYFGYFGTATLTGVQPVPLPGTLELLLPSLMLVFATIVLMRRTYRPGYGATMGNLRRADAGFNAFSLRLS